MSLGYSHDEFWDQTPYTLQLTFDANADRLEREHNDRAWLAWHIAALGRSRKFPMLSKLQIKQKRQAEPWQKQLEDLKAWVVANGGKIINETEH